MTSKGRRRYTMKLVSGWIWNSMTEDQKSAKILDVIIDAASKVYGIPKHMLLGQVRRESR